MADEEQLKILRQGVEVWNAWRQKNRGVRVDLREVHLERASLGGANLSGANLRDAYLRYANLGGADLGGADLGSANLGGADLGSANLIGASLTDADLGNANLGSANLRDAYLLGANLRNANLLGAHLRDAHLIDANLSGANLKGADLRGAYLRDAHLNRAHLNRAHLGGANLIGANLSGANLSGADFLGANLSDAILSGARLANATFAQAFLSNTAFANVDLSIALDLETARPAAPSTIGIDTLYKSGGKIPEAFLRGCGVPDSFIAQVKALIGAEEGMQFYSCFISYSGVDEEFARRLHGRLQQEHVRVWFAPEDLHSGQKLHEQIDEAIKVFDKLLIVLSPNSLKSEWVITELRKARKRERQHGKRKLFPLSLVSYETLREWECFDADHGQDLATEVREYFIPDFTNWKDHDAFEAAFARLLKDLRATDLKAAG